MCADAAAASHSSRRSLEPEQGSGLSEIRTTAPFVQRLPQVHPSAAILRVRRVFLPAHDITAHPPAADP
jgi:hypothetical protein